MMNYFEKFITTNALSKIAILSIALLTLISASLNSGFNGAGDIFHQGEMLGNYWHMLKYYNNTASYPLVIHGTMDYWPSLLAGHIFGTDKIIYGTRLIIVCITVFSWGIFAFTGISILSRGNNNNSSILAFVAIFCFTLPMFNLNVMSIEESPVGLRDIFLLLQICLLMHYYISKENGLYFLVAIFLLLPITLYWSYDRGVAATLACMAFLAYLIYSKQYKKFLVSFIAVVISVVFFELTNVAGLFNENISNIYYWSKYSGEVWGTKFNLNLQSFVALLPLIFIGATFFHTYIAHKMNKDTVPVGIILFVFIIETILVKSAYNRPNIHRGLMSVWPTVLLFLWLISSKIQITRQTIIKNESTAGNPQSKLIGLSMISIVCAIFYFSIPFGKISLYKKSIMSPPSDSSIAGSSLAQVANILKGENCSLNMVNQGIITLLSKTSHCTKFPYLIYANKEAQIELIENINKLKIKTIVIESNDWSTNIDDRSMKSRLPDLHSFIFNSYTKKIFIDNYIVLQR